MSLSPRFMDALRSRLSLSEIVGRRVKLTRAGREFKGCCPFHNEKTPSFYVNDDKQFFHCFGCGAHGDVIGFTMRLENLSFPEAVEALAVEAGMEIPKPSPQDAARARQERDLHALVEETTLFFEENLRRRGNEDALGYLRGRGLREETISGFRLGFAPADGGSLRAHLLKKGFRDEEMIESGVLHVSTRGEAPYAFFRDRIIFPVADRRGRVVAFGGRVMPDHLRPPSRSGHKPPKYINSSETPLFHKGEMLYGLAQARQAAGENHPVLVVEGYLDVIACHQAGFRGAVAPLGTALTEEQIMALWGMIPGREKVPVLCFDGDEAGRRAATRAASRILPLLGPDRSVKISFLPEGQDPDTLILSQGTKAFESVLGGAMGLADFIWSGLQAGRSVDTPEARAGLARDLEAEALKIADRSVQEYYLRSFRDRVREAFFAFRSSKNGRTPSVGLSVRRPAFAGERLRGAILVATILNHPEIFDAVEEDFCGLEWDDPGLSRLYGAVLSCLHTNPGLDRARLQGHLTGAGLENEMGRVLCEAVYNHAGFARPKAEREDALEGWRETLLSVRAQGMGQEIRNAKRALSGEFSMENESRLIALQKMAGKKEN
ncbi:MAG: DNA primase [Rhodospirillales bacterium]|nr:DNA primase [Rhodospirillales bacterium]